MATTLKQSAPPAQQRAAVDTSKVTGRRTVRYESFDEVLADAERLAGTQTRTLGNWSLGQICKHLANSIDMMIDGPAFMLPAPMRLVLWLVMKKKMLRQTLPPGFQVPKGGQAVLPDATTTEEGLALLRAAVRRVNGTSQRGLHPAFGKMGPGEWDQFQLRHCEMHLSFVVPASGT